MFSSLAFSAALLAPAAPMPKDTTPSPTGPSPQVVYFNGQAPASSVRPAPVGLAGGKTSPLMLTTYTTKKVEVNVTEIVNGKAQRVKKEIDQRMGTSKALGERKEVFATVDGSKLSTEEAIRRLSGGAVALISMDGKPIDAGWLRVVDKDIITIHSAEITEAVYAGYNRNLVKTPAPRLAMLSPDMDGVIRVAASDAQNPANGGFGGGQIVVQANVNGGIVLPGQIQFDAARGGAAAKIEKRPLDQVNFEAYTAKGESVTKEEALRRLKAGGIVAIAGSNQKPDETYLKSFTPDLLVLVSAELVGTTPRTGGIIRGMPIQVQPLPAPVPAAPAAPLPVVKPGAPLPPQPVDEEKPAAGNALPNPVLKPGLIRPLPAQILPVPQRKALPLPIETDKTPKELPKS